MTPEDGLLTLSSGALDLVISPGLGGSIARFDYAGPDGRMPVLRGSDAIPARVLDAGSFPLVPFVNRIRNGRFTFRGRDIRLTPNMDGDKSPLHGQGWTSPWTVEAADAETAELRFVHDPGEWPWRYEARQSFALDPRGLDLRLTCRNLSDEPMPCGLGQHPYFPCTPETRIDTQVSHVWTIDADVLPVAKLPAEGRFSLKDRAICGQGLDHGFARWSGSARIWTPGTPFEIVISSPTARFFQLYSPEVGGLFVAEPVTHANAAMNAPEEDWPELGFAVLEPGEEMTLDVRFDVRQVTPS